MELRAAIAPQASEDVAREAFGVSPQKHRRRGVDLAQDEGKVILFSKDVLVGVQLPEPRLFVTDRNRGFDAPGDQLLVPAAVGDDLLDCYEHDLVLSREALELRHARHGSVGLHELCDHAGRVQAGQDREIDRRFGLTGTGQHSPLGGPERKRVPGHREIGFPRRWFEDFANRGGAVMSGSARGRDVLGVDAHAERGAEPARVALDHGCNAELVESPRDDRHADEARTGAGHDADVLWSDQLRSHDEVALVFAVFVVDDDDELARLEISDRLRHSGQPHLLEECYRWRFRATYRATTSASRLTIEPRL